MAGILTHLPPNSTAARDLSPDACVVGFGIAGIPVFAGAAERASNRGFIKSCIVGAEALFGLIVRRTVGGLGMSALPFGFGLAFAFPDGCSRVEPSPAADDEDAASCDPSPVAVSVNVHTSD